MCVLEIIKKKKYTLYEGKQLNDLRWSQFLWVVQINHCDQLIELESSAHLAIILTSKESLVSKKY